MKSVICTLFEGNYHLGLIGLINSLYKQGYRGVIYAGFRGVMPKWANQATENTKFNWQGSQILKIAEGLDLFFLPLVTKNDLTNYKPDFMISILDGPETSAPGIFYFDPDIVVSAPWSYFDEWIDCGVAVCEDVNSPIPANHPRRTAWRQYFGGHGISLSFKDSIYVNGGFIGITKKDYGFLFLWKTIQELMALKIGGLNRSIFSKIPLSEVDRGPHAPFSKTDQDAMNATIEAWNDKISYVGQEGMGFKSGEAQMTHAIGTSKPWQNNYLINSLCGNPPRKVDREFWNAVNGPIKGFSTIKTIIRKMNIMIAVFIGRFYKRS